MPKIIQVRSYNKDFFRKIWLKILVHHFSEEEHYNDSFEESDLILSTRHYAIQYLKSTNQYRKQFQLSLRPFHGRTAHNFDDEFVSSIKTIYEDHVIELSRDILSFAEAEHYKKNKLILDFNEVDIPDKNIGAILRDLFDTYGSEVLNMETNPWTCNIACINDSSLKTINRFEGKLRKIGQYACIDEVLEFVRIRIGLYKTYNYKILVDGLDELVRHFLVDTSTHEINKVKAQHTTKQLVNEAVSSYEVLNNPKYLIDNNLFRSALTRKIKGTLNRY